MYLTIPKHASFVKSAKSLLKIRKNKSENIRAYILIRFKLGIEALMNHKELKKAVRAHAACLKNIYNCINEFKKKTV